jgi:hypothetical protein
MRSAIQEKTWQSDSKRLLLRRKHSKIVILIKIKEIHYLLPLDE